MCVRKTLVGIIALMLVLVLPVQSAFAGSLPADWQRGANVTAWWHDAYEQPKADQEIARLRMTGTTHASFVVTWYMNDASDSRIARDPNRTPTDASVLHAMEKARSLGMTVVLKPHVDLQDGSFRGAITPADAGAWFADYTAMLNHYADLAQQGGASMLIVGTELSTMSPYEAQWRSVIAGVRARFSGKLTYAANHIDAAAKMGFWDALDYLGIDAYEPLSWSDPDPSVETLAANWCQATDASGHVHRYYDDLAGLQARWQKPVVFTELGYESRVGTALTPWGGATGAISQSAQRNAYEAAFRVWSRVPWFKGIYWWNWDAGAGNDDPGDGGLEFAGKAAGNTVATWNTAAPSDAGGSPCGTAAVGAKTKITLAAKTKRTRSGRKLGRLSGRLTRGAKPCAAPVVIEIKRRGGRVSRRTVRSTSARSGRYAIVARKLRRGRYTASARPDGGSCGSARSSRVRFRIR